MNTKVNIIHPILLICAFTLFASTTQAKIMPTYSTDNPAVLQYSKQNIVQLVVTPQQAIYQTMPQISIAYHGKRTMTLHWQADNAFGVKITSGSIQLAAHTSPQNIKLPDGHGYYALTLHYNKQEQHYSFGVLPAMMQKQPDIFGVWVQGMREYPSLGVSWTRVAVYYEKWNKDKKYRKLLHTICSRLKEYGVSVLLYPKGVPKNISVSHNYIRDDTKSWNVFSQWMTEIVQEFDGDVAAWGLINEPFAYVAWKIPNEITLRYWKMMRAIVDKHSPNTPLIGPCLNVHKGAQLRQYRELMQAGFGKLVDGIELHTYMHNVSNKGINFEHAMPEDIDWYTRMHQALLDAGNGKIKHDIWVTEMGMSATYEQELQQATFVTRSALWAKYMQGNGVPIRMLNWHAFSFPQGGTDRARNYSLFRNTAANARQQKKNSMAPQSRPAAIAYGTSIRHLNGATFVRQWSGLPAQTYAFEFKNQDKRIVALWTTQTSADILLPKQARQGILSNMFGKQLPISKQGRLQLNHAPLWIEYK